MLQIKNLTIRLTKDLRTILEDFSFALNRGDKAVIIGEEGNGKSTLIKLIHDESSVDSYVEYDGSIYRGDGRYGYLPQEMSAEDRMTPISRYLTDAQGAQADPAELAQIAMKLGFPFERFASDQLAGTLSGGEKVKLQLCRLLLAQPDALLLDEPTNDIDIETLEWLEGFINGCGLPVLYVSHDETLIERTANVVIHIEQVRKKTLCRHTVARMPYAQYMSERAAKLRHQDQVARKEKEEVDKKYARWQQVYERVDHEQRVISRQNPGGGRLLKKKMKSVKSQEKQIQKQREGMTQLPDVEDAIIPSFSRDIEMPAGKTVLEFDLPRLEVEGSLLASGVRLRICGPEHVCIIGKNGTGKTTLLRAIAEELLPRRDIKAAYMPQNYEDLLDFRQTPVDFLAPSGRKDDITRARTFLGSMKYTADEMEHKTADLSGGQKAKLLFIKMILDECNVLILDEPTRNFSPLSNPVIREILRDYGGAIVSVSHDRKYISEVCGRVLRLTADGLSPAELR